VPRQDALLESSHRANRVIGSQTTLSYKDSAMQHGQTMRTSAKAFFAFAALAMVGACADNSAAPVANAPAVHAPANFTEVGYSVVFRVNNWEGITKRVGDHVINIPAGAICDLETSGYGSSFWDKPCMALRGSVVVTATVFKGPNGEPYVDFQPAMRFAPNKEVMLFFREGTTDGTKQPTTKYCNDLGICVDESIDDPSLRLFRIGKTSILARRLKHFSGYVVVYDWQCPGTATPLPDGQGYYCEEGGFSRRSGYMVASGEDVSEVMKDKDQDDKKDKDSQ
jgi:hypothetical protein